MSSKNRISFANVPKVLYENRYCNQDGFSILACGGLHKNKKRVNQVLEIKIPSFEITIFPSMEKRHFFLNLTSIKSDLYGIVDNLIEYGELGGSCTSIEVYSEETKTWKHQYVNFEERFGYCLRSFMNKLYIIGGYVKSEKKGLSSCYIYNIKSNERNKIADLNKERYWAACTVFEGKVVVTGGFSKSERCKLKSIEAYDYYENKWTYLPNMIDKRCHHASVSVGNKLFIIGGYKISSCEVFDSCSRKFTFINSNMKVSAFEINYFRAICIGSIIVVFHHSQKTNNIHSNKSVLYMYNVNESKWSIVDCSYTKNCFVPSCIKYYVQ